MKFLVLFFFCFTQLFAEEPEKRNIGSFEEAKKLSKEAKYEESLQQLDRSFRLQEDPLKAPKAVLELAAYNFEQMRSYKAAITHLYIIVNRNYAESHKVIEELYQNKKVEEFNEKRKTFPEEQSKLYLQIAKQYSHILNDQLYELPQEEIKDAEEKGLFYYRLAYLKYPGEAIRGIQAIEEVQQDEKFRTYKGRWYLPTSIIIWQDQVKVTRGSTSEEVSGNARALAFGVGYRRENKYQGYHLELQGFYGYSDLKDNNTLTRYHSSSNSLYGVMFAPGFMGHALVRNLVLGIEVPLLYKKGDYDRPSAGMTLDNESMLAPGILGMLAVTSKKLDLVFKIGKFYHMSGPFASFGLNFNLGRN